MERYATALQPCYILYKKKLLWPVVSQTRRVTTVEFTLEDCIFSMGYAIVAMESH